MTAMAIPTGATRGNCLMEQELQYRAMMKEYSEEARCAGISTNAEIAAWRNTKIG
jgi:hypothetical protein